MKYKVSLILFALFFVAVSCSQEKKKPKVTEVHHPANPNGDSELALFMRQMFDDAYLVKEQILNEKPVTAKIDHDKILTAHATEPDKVATPEYKAFAQTYLNAIEALNNATPDNVEDRYAHFVGTCRSCHQVFCPGPLVKIAKLDYVLD